MQALVRSTWLAVGPGRDSLLLASQNNAPALPAPLAPLRSGSLVALSSRCPPRCYSESLNAGRLSVISGMPEHLFGKQGNLSLCTYCPLSIPPLCPALSLVLFVWAISQDFDLKLILSDGGGQ